MAKPKGESSNQPAVTRFLTLHRGSPRGSEIGWRAATDDEEHYVYAIALQIPSKSCQRLYRTGPAAGPFRGSARP